MRPSFHLSHKRGSTVLFMSIVTLIILLCTCDVLKEILSQSCSEKKPKGQRKKPDGQRKKPERANKKARKAKKKAKWAKKKAIEAKKKKKKKKKAFQLFVVLLF